MSDKKITPEQAYERIVEGFVNAYLIKINNMARMTLRQMEGKKK